MWPRSRTHRAVDVAVALVLLAIIVLTLLFVFGGLLSGCNGCGPHVSINLAPAFIASLSGICGAHSRTYNVSLNPSASTTTGMFGITIKNESGEAAPVRGVAGSAPEVAFAKCDPAQGGWDAVLWSPTGALQAYYSSGGTDGWTAGPDATLPITIQSGANFEVISSYNLSNDSLSALGVNGNDVSGSTIL